MKTNKSLREKKYKTMKKSTNGFSAKRIVLRKLTGERLVPHHFHTVLIGEDYFWHEVTGEPSAGVLT
jgi:hypothetical protein